MSRGTSDLRSEKRGDHKILWLDRVGRILYNILCVALNAAQEKGYCGGGETAAVE